MNYNNKRNKEIHTIGDPYYKKSKKFKSKRIQGDSIYFLLLHSLISMMLFFIFASSMGIFSTSTKLLSELISWEFIQGLFVIFGLMLIFGVIGRILAYITMRIVINVYAKRETKKLGELMKGLNGISLNYFLSTFISACLFAFSALAIIQSRIFGEATLWSLVVTYSVVKIVVFIITRLISSWKL